MAVSRSKAYEVLGLEEDASYDQIRSAYKKLALLWHPDKHGNSEEATKKFQEISSAYKRLTTEDEEDLIDLSFEEMFDLFTHLVFGGRGYIPGNYYFDASSDSDDHCCDYHHRQKKNGFRHTSSPSTRTSLKKEKTRINKPSFEEAKTNGDALIREEEREKRQKEKKRERKRKRKQRKREEKETQAKAFTSSQQQSESEESDESDSEEDEEEELNKKNQFKVSSNNQNGFQQLTNNTKHTMPNKKSNSSDKKHNPSDKKQSSSLKNATGTSNKKNNSDHMTQNGGSGGTSNNKSSKNNKNFERKKEKDGSSGEDEATQGLDLSSAFFAGTVSSVNKKLASQNQKKNKKEGGGRPEVESVESTENKIQKSRKLAIRGNELANKGDYRGAIELFSSAISLDPSDHRFFGNRSYCFDQSNQYDKALKDAERAISLAKEWPKGYFRKGRALAGLKSFNDAEKAYEQVLKLDPGCEEAMQELKRVRVLQLMDMGFMRVQSEIAVIKCGNVQAAAEALLSGALDENSLQDLDEEVYISEEEDVLTETIQKAKTDARNPEKLRSIWIGNLSQDATEKQVRDLFGRFGEIESMRRLSEKFCAFINYRDASMASEAMRNLQGYQFFDSQLLIKFPDHPITDGHLQTIYLKKNKPSGDAPLQPQQPQRQKTPQQPATYYSNKQSMNSYSQGGKPGGPVNGNECYFWRTTGCWYGERCRYKHLPGSKGADLQPWHRGASAE